jgi:hypothetical protein
LRTLRVDTALSFPTLPAALQRALILVKDCSMLSIAVVARGPDESDARFAVDGTLARCKAATLGNGVRALPAPEVRESGFRRQPEKRSRAGW